MPTKDSTVEYAQKYRLTEREKEVFELLVSGVVSPGDIGKKMEISLHTVNNHLKKILEKTNTDSKAELLADFLLFLEQSLNTSPKTRPQVLILDDETELTQMLQKFLQLRDIDTVSFNDSSLALDAIRKHKIDVVVSDIRMPKMNGISFLQEIRKFHFYEPGVIFISAFPEEHGVEKLLDLGAFAFLDKPVDLEKLNRLIWEYVYGNRESKTQSPISMSLNDIKLSKAELGFGGFFLSEEHISKQSGVKLDAGELVNISFEIPGISEIHNVTCEVVWMREEDPNGKGYGLRFVKIEPNTKKQVLDFVRTNNILSCIPSCH